MRMAPFIELPLEHKQLLKKGKNISWHPLKEELRRWKVMPWTGSKSCSTPLLIYSSSEWASIHYTVSKLWNCSKSIMVQAPWVQLTSMISHVKFCRAYNCWCFWHDDLQKLLTAEGELFSVLSDGATDRECYWERNSLYQSSGVTSN